MNDILERLRGSLIVSCQASKDSPLHGPAMMNAMARAAEIGGAEGIRAEGITDIKEIRKSVDLPMIGIIKDKSYDSEVYITPTLEEINKILSLGVEIVAFDATERDRPTDASTKEICSCIAENHALSMADISSLKEAKHAADSGAHIISTTLSGYTEGGRKKEGPDLELVKKISDTLERPVFAEGRIRFPEQAKKALELGAHAVVVGSAITRPHEITESFVDTMRDSHKVHKE